MVYLKQQIIMQVRLKSVAVFFLLTGLLFCISCTGQVKGGSQKKSEVITEDSKIRIDPETFQNENINCGLEDKKGDLWFGTTLYGIFHYHRGIFTNYTMEHGLISNRITSIYQTKDSALWIGTDSGVCRFHNNSIQRIPFHNELGIPFTSSEYVTDLQSESNKVWSILQDQHGKIWFGTTKGIYNYDGKTVRPFYRKDSLGNDTKSPIQEVQCIFEDHGGNLWFATSLAHSEGVFRYDGNNLTNYKPNGQIWIRKIIQDKKGIMWFATRNKGIVQYNGKSFTVFGEKEPFHKTGTESILFDKKGKLWFASLGLNPDEGIWSYDGIKFTNYTMKDGLKSNTVWFMMEDSNGYLWIATRDMGLHRYDGKTFTSFTE
jgi:ligand-binding sensor domain-containing protein